MKEPISRRSALVRMLAAFDAARLLAWQAPTLNPIGSDEPTRIVPGERFGDVFLEMTKPEVLGLLGKPCETSEFKAEDYSELEKLYEQVNRMTGSNLKVEKFPRPASTYFNYDRLGLSVCFQHERAVHITAYTGVRSGYEKGDAELFSHGPHPRRCRPAQDHGRHAGSLRHPRQFGLP